MSGRTVSMACWMTPASSTLARRSSMCPRLMRLTSRRSSTRRTRFVSCRSVTARTRPTASALAPGCFITSRPVRSGASGLRSSCASIARNSSFRLAASRSASSARRRSVMSMPDDCTSVARPSSSNARPRFVQSVHRGPSVVSKRFSIRTAGASGLSSSSIRRTEAWSSFTTKSQKSTPASASGVVPRARA